MTTRLWDEPVPVHLRTDRGWVLAWAFGVRRTTGGYEVLVGRTHGAPSEERTWVDRARVRPIPHHHG